MHGCALRARLPGAPLRGGLCRGPQGGELAIALAQLHTEKAGLAAVRWVQIRASEEAQTQHPPTGLPGEATRPPG